MTTETFLASYGLIAFQLFERYGVDVNALAAQAGINLTALTEEGCRLPSDHMDRLFEAAAQQIADPAFALHASDQWSPANLGTLGYAWLSSDTLRTALQRLARFSQVVGQKTQVRCLDEPRGVRLTLAFGRDDRLIAYLLADFTLSILVAMCRMNYGVGFSVAEATLRRPRPGQIHPYEEYFGGNLRFGAAADSLLLSEEVADKALATANHSLAVTFDHILIQELASLDAADLISRCKAYLLQEFSDGDPSEEKLARSLAMSRRTLQRKLGEYGLTFKQLLEQTRYELATHYLGDPSNSITDITFRLGFSELSAFTRAFRRWHGTSPTAYRATLPH